MILRFVAPAALVGVTLCSAALAYEYLGGSPSPRWPGAEVDLRLSQQHFKNGTIERDALIDAIDRWNTAPSKFDFDVVNDNATPALGNGKSEAFYSASNYYLSGALAVTHLNIWGGNINEADVVFGSKEPWHYGEQKTALLAYGDKYLNFRAVALHELGHVLGLGHEDDTYNVMGEAYEHLSTNGVRAIAYPGEDSTHGAINLYGADSSAEDVGVTHFKLSGSWSGYSLHSRTQVFDGVTNKALPTFTKPNGSTFGEIGYQVTAGQSVVVEFGIENNGSTLQQPSTGYYWSTNDLISTSDTLLATASPSVDRNTVYLRRQTVTIPSTATVDQVYHLGIVVDRFNSIGEFEESNNATYVAVKVVN